MRKAKQARLCLRYDHRLVGKDVPKDTNGHPDKDKSEKYISDRFDASQRIRSTMTILVFAPVSTIAGVVAPSCLRSHSLFLL